jgi:peptidoglycan glycosyltransferase
VPLLVLSAGLLYLSYLDRQEQLLRAHLALREGDFSGCAEGFASLTGSVWAKEQASAGTAICRALASEEQAPTRILQAQEPILDRFEVRAALHRELTSGHYQSCLNLARLVGGDALKEAPLYAAAALLELGQRNESQAAFSNLPESLKRSPLGRRVDRVLSVLAKDALAVVQDRKGTPIGWLTKDRTFRFLDGIDQSLLPLDTLHAALDDNPAASVRLSIDLELSAIAERALRGYRGSIVLVSPRTGEILAAVSDRRTRRKMADPAFKELREPASISKLITTVAALRSGLDPNAEIGKMRCRGAERFEGDYLYCSNPAGRLKGLNHAMAISCNVAFANLGVETGRDALLNELRRFGFGSPEQHGMRFGRILDERLDERKLADASIGLEYTETTPLHAALIAATFANDGKMPEPTLFSARDGLLGLSTQQPLESVSRQVVDPQWLPVLRDSMLAVVHSGGTAHGVEPRGFTVAMKTGTAAAPGLGYHTNYIGYGPVDEPTVAFCVRITGIRSSRTIGQVSRSVTYRLLRYLNRHKDWLEHDPKDIRLQWTTYFEEVEELAETS